MRALQKAKRKEASDIHGQVRDRTFRLLYEFSIPPADGFDFAVGDANGKGSYVEKVTGRQF